MANQSLRYWLLDEFVNCGITGYTVTTCTGAGRRNLQLENVAENEHIRIEIIAPEEVCNTVIDFLRRDILPDHHVTACIETVDVVRIGHFAPVDDVLAIGTDKKSPTARSTLQAEGANRTYTAPREVQSAAR